MGPCPLEDPILNKKILAIALRRHAAGSDRQTADRRGHPRGVWFEHSGFGKDYYCCQAWRRPNGEVWRISLLLHFEKAGNFCETLDLPDLNPDHPSRPRVPSERRVGLIGPAA